MEILDRGKNETNKPMGIMANQRILYLDTDSIFMFYYYAF